MRERMQPNCVSHPIGGWFICGAGAVCALLIAAVLVVGPCSAVVAAPPVGRIIEVQGSAETKRTDAWQTAVANGEVFRGDRLRTGPDGRLRLELEPDNSITLGPETEIVIERHKFDAAGWNDTLITLVAGNIRGAADSTYDAGDSQFRIATPTAQVRAFAGEFAIEYSARRGATDVFGLRGRLNVRGTLDPGGTAVVVTAKQAARVKQNAGPEPAYRTDWLRFDAPPDVAVDFFTSRLLESAMWLGNPILAGAAGVRVEPMNLPLAAGSIPGGNPRASSVANGNDTASVLGQSPAGLTGPGRLRVVVQGN